MLQAVRRGAALEGVLDANLRGLADADRRLAHQLLLLVLRHQQNLDAILEPFVPRGLTSVKPQTLDLLRLAAAQLRYLDRIPPHAAVGTAVSLARSPGGGGSSGFVNAVLRRVAALAPEALAASDERLHPADAAAHPRWLVARWTARFGLSETQQLMEWNNSQPALVLQPARRGSAELMARWNEAGIPVFPAPWQAGLVVELTRPELLPGYAEGDFQVQDPAQALVVRYSGFPRGSLVYDACAAPGGKALALGSLGHVVLAADRSRPRVQRLLANLRRAGSGREYPLLADATAPPVGSVDGYLLDAPCLGTGTFARHPDARLRVTQSGLEELVRQQAVLLECAAQRVSPGGILCYATCSLEPEENEMQVDSFLKRHPEFSRVPPPDFPGELLSSAGDLTLLPQRHGTDGAFAARLERRR